MKSSTNRTTNSYTFRFPCPLLSLSYVRYDNTAPAVSQSTSASRSDGWRRVLPWLTDYTRRIDRSSWALDQSGRWSVNRKQRQYLSFNNPSLKLAHAAAFCAGCIPNCTPWRKQSCRQTIVSNSSSEIVFYDFDYAVLQSLVYRTPCLAILFVVTVKHEVIMKQAMGKHMSLACLRSVEIILKKISIIINIHNIIM